MSGSHAINHHERYRSINSHSIANSVLRGMLSFIHRHTHAFRGQLTLATESHFESRTPSKDCGQSSRFSARNPTSSSGLRLSITW
jgi:hypothetical protein